MAARGGGGKGGGCVRRGGKKGGGKRGSDKKNSRTDIKVGRGDRRSSDGKRNRQGVQDTVPPPRKKPPRK